MCIHILMTFVEHAQAGLVGQGYAGPPVDLGGVALTVEQAFPLPTTKTRARARTRAHTHCVCVHTRIVCACTHAMCVRAHTHCVCVH